MNPEIESLRAEVRRLGQEVDRLRQSRQEPVAHEYPDLPAAPRAPAPDLPGFFPRRMGPPDFNTIIFAPGAYLDSAGTFNAFFGQEVTVSDITYVWAKWDRDDAVWLTDSGNLLWSGTEIPASTMRYVSVPVCQITWSSAGSRIDQVVAYHVGLLTPPAERLPNGNMDYDGLFWDQSNWSGQLTGERTKAWVPEIARGHANPP